ncbi:hypothetical protein [Dickeya parazeae]|nr:hypothetical protein [Dickeya parazeae]
MHANKRDKRLVEQLKVDDSGAPLSNQLTMLAIAFEASVALL